MVVRLCWKGTVTEAFEQRIVLAMTLESRVVHVEVERAWIVAATVRRKTALPNRRRRNH